MKVLVVIFSVLLIMIFPGAVLAQNELSGKYFVLRDQRGKIITSTVHQMVIGDQYLNSANRLYQVIRVKGNTGIAKFVRTEKLETPKDWRSRVASLFNLEFFRAQIKSKGPICVYHTHSDESYDSSDGTSSIKGRGGIFQVGDALTSAFESEGIPVVHDKTPHDPHDSFAYDRSRRTAVQLLKRRPPVLLDVHRDAIPAEAYAAVVNGQNVTKVQLVVGRQNPNFSANNDFAKQIKANCDKRYPNLIKGIFYGKGKFNQDLGPRTMLLEFGSNTNTKDAAERGAKVFAAAAKDALYGNAGGGITNRGSWRSLFWIVVAALGGLGLFLLINRRGLKDIGKEFSGAVGEGEVNEEPEKTDDDPNQGRH